MGLNELTEEQRLLIEGLREDAVARGDTEHSVACKPDDPAFALLLDGHHSMPVVHLPGCYICEDPEFAAMGLPLCRKCPWCGLNGHVPADDEICDMCGGSDCLWYELSKHPAVAGLRDWAEAYFGLCIRGF